VQWPLVCFHAQQAAEKYLKAFLVSHGIEAEKTHDLERLLETCLERDPGLTVLHSDCQQLTDYAMDSRGHSLPGHQAAR
jgi:HEPN domain-containing protein